MRISLTAHPTDSTLANIPIWTSVTVLQKLSLIPGCPSLLCSISAGASIPRTSIWPGELTWSPKQQIKLPNKWKMYWVSSGSAPHRRHCKLQRNVAGHGWLLHTQRTGRIISTYPYAFLPRAHGGFADKTQLCHVCQTWGCHGNITFSTVFVTRAICPRQELLLVSSTGTARQVPAPPHCHKGPGLVCFGRTMCPWEWKNIPSLQWWASLLLNQIISKSCNDECKC